MVTGGKKKYYISDWFKCQQKLNSFNLKKCSQRITSIEQASG